MTINQNPYNQLLTVIEKLEQELIDYKKSPKAIEYITEKRLTLINQLKNILSDMHIYNVSGVVNTIAHQLAIIKKNDEECDSILIRVDYSPNAQKTAFLKIAAHV